MQVSMKMYSENVLKYKEHLTEWVKNGNPQKKCQSKNIAYRGQSEVTGHQNGIFLPRN